MFTPESIQSIQQAAVAAIFFGAFMLIPPYLWISIVTKLVARSDKRKAQRKAEMVKEERQRQAVARRQYAQDLLRQIQ